jgi:hypothetical protein
MSMPSRSQKFPDLSLPQQNMGQSSESGGVGLDPPVHRAASLRHNT